MEIGEKSPLFPTLLSLVILRRRLARPLDDAEISDGRDGLLGPFHSIVPGWQQRFGVGAILLTQERSAEQRQSVQPILDSQAWRSFEVGSVGGQEECAVY